MAELEVTAYPGEKEVLLCDNVEMLVMGVETVKLDCKRLGLSSQSTG